VNDRKSSNIQEEKQSYRGFSYSSVFIKVDIYYNACDIL